ncbi:MAG: metallophosphoesterase [Vicinamibacterales bacterium]
MASAPSAAPASSAPSAAQAAPPPLRFAVIGDFGTGSRRQFETARQMWDQHERYPYSFVLTVGDNIYGGQDPADMERKFVVPYKPVIDAEIPFYASLGNHDNRAQVKYELFNMGGQPYYTFTKGPAQFFALDSTLMTPAQLRWLEDELTRSEAPWKIAYFHHPIYSSGLRHGPTLVLRAALEPIFATFGVQLVFTGHEHFYERLQPRYGIQQFITGSGGQLRRNGIRRGSLETAAGYDQDTAFLLGTIDGDTFSFEVINRQGKVVDSGTVMR